LGFQVDRAVLDRVLLNEAAAAGAIVRHSSPVRDVTRESADVARIFYESEGAVQETRARWVLDCTGRTGLMAKREWRRGEEGSRTLALIGVWEAPGGFDLDDDTHTLVESYEGGWAWSVPVKPMRRYFTVMVDPALTPVAGSAELDATYRAELTRAPHLGNLVKRAELAGAPWARDASSYSCSNAGEPGLLLVGDAASFVDPLSSYGVKKALASAWLASVVAHTSLVDASMQGAALALYEQRERAMYEALSQRSAALAREAADTHATSFWSARAIGDTREIDADADVAALREDADVLSAFAEIRRRPSIPLRRGDAVDEVLRPTVHENRVVLEPHLTAPGFSEGMRYLRNIDLVTLARLAPSHDQVPLLYEAYSRAAAPVPLPDFLGALSVLVGKRVLTFI
jgi:flavin-dependent dehydrogenase